MVGVGPSGKRSALARVVVVSFDEQVVYAAFARPPEKVTDWRTAISGVHPRHMAHALPLRQVQSEVAALLRGRIIIGHALHNDLRALMLEHPKKDVRDTSLYPAYRAPSGPGTKPRKLQTLAKELLSWEIQGAQHSPSEDAVAALRLYKLKMSEWERGGGGGGKSRGGGGGGGAGAHVRQSKWERDLAKGKQRKKKRKFNLPRHSGGGGR